MSLTPSTRLTGRATLTIFVAVLTVSAAKAGTIRHDRSDHAHVAGANAPELAAVGQLLVRGNASCSGTLIAPQWVLTATHCIWSGGDFLDRQTIVIGKQRFSVGPDDIFLHPDWLLGGFDVSSTRGDIALIRLPVPVAGVTPIAINRERNEVGQTAYIAGFGSTGNGMTGNTKRTSNKRVGMNVIDATAKRVVFSERYPLQQAEVGSSRALLVDFDSPDRHASTLGDSVPLNLEYSASQGDSGGPLLLYENRMFKVAGVVSGGLAPQGHPRFTSFYATVGTFARVSSYLRWIDSVMNGRGMNLTRYRQTLAQDGGRAVEQARMKFRERGEELRARGLRLQAWRAEPLPPDGWDEPLLPSSAALKFPEKTASAATLFREIAQAFREQQRLLTEDGRPTPKAAIEEVIFSDCPCCGVASPAGD